MSAEKPRIFHAMEELRERRAHGEFVHGLIEEVADNWDVSPIKLKEFAETSWGSPLETDRERNAAKFNRLADERDIADQARAAARTVWDSNLAGLKEFSFWQVRWDRDVEEIISASGLDWKCEEIVRSAFMEEARRLEATRSRLNA